MAVNIPAQTVAANFYPATPVTALSLDLTETAATPAGNETPLVDGKTMLLVHNTDASGHTISVTSAVDSLNRKGDISAYAIAAGKTAILGPFRTAGWASAGKLLFQADDATVKIAVITLP